MKLTSDLLARWVAASGRSTGKDLRGASLVDLASALVPIVQPQLPLTNTAIALGSTVTDSFAITNVGQQAQSLGPFQTVLVNIAPGAWDISVTLFSQATFTLAADLMNVQLWGPGPGFGTVNLVNAPIQANFPAYANLTRQFTLDTPPKGQTGWHLDHYRPATGVGQTFIYSCTVIGFRLS